METLPATRQSTTQKLAHHPVCPTVFFQEPQITSFKKPITKPETKDCRILCQSPDIKVPSLDANVAARQGND